MRTMENCSLIVHGGAIANERIDYAREIEFLRNLAAEQGERIGKGVTALLVVRDTLRILEECGLFIAGRGASPNEVGDYELDAAIADGASGRAGSVACLSGFKYPSVVAGAILENEREPLWMGNGAAHLARSYHCDEIADPKEWYRPRFNSMDDTGLTGFGTAGIVARDLRGNVASGTTTGGLLSKRPGRVGDTPILGAGTWADKKVAISCTGDGQAFLRASAAAYVAHRQELISEPLHRSLIAALGRVSVLGGQGALVAIDTHGAGAVQHSCAGIKFGVAISHGHVFAGRSAISSMP